MNKELLFSVTKKDFDFQYFCSGGPGGQHQNKTSSACRVIHRESGAVGESRDEREQSRNKITAFKRCVNSKVFQSWLKRKTSELMMEESIESKLDKMMHPNNIRTEIKENNKWKVVTDMDNLSE